MQTYKLTPAQIATIQDNAAARAAILEGIRRDEKLGYAGEHLEAGEETREDKVLENTEYIEWTYTEDYLKEYLDCEYWDGRRAANAWADEVAESVELRMVENDILTRLDLFEERFAPTLASDRDFLAGYLTTQEYLTEIAELDPENEDILDRTDYALPSTMFTRPSEITYEETPTQEHGEENMTMNARYAEFLTQAAARCPKYADNKVYIADLYEEVRSYGSGQSLSAFKQHLMTLYRRQFAHDGEDLGFTLLRADLGYATMPERMEPSEITYMGATFHLFTW